MTAKTLSSFVHCRHLAFMSESLVGSYDTISGSILRQLMPPRALTSSTNVWIDVTSSSLELENANACWIVLRLAHGNTTLIDVGLTPRSLAVSVPHLLCTGALAPPLVPDPLPFAVPLPVPPPEPPFAPDAPLAPAAPVVSPGPPSVPRPGVLPSARRRSPAAVDTVEVPWRPVRAPTAARSATSVPMMTSTTTCTTAGPLLNVRHRRRVRTVNGGVAPPGPRAIRVPLPPQRRFAGALLRRVPVPLCFTATAPDRARASWLAPR